MWEANNGGDTTQLERLIAEHGDVHAVDSRVSYRAHRFTKLGRFFVCPCFQKRTALHLAALGGNLAALHVLLKAGAAVDAEDEARKTAGLDRAPGY